MSGNYVDGLQTAGHKGGLCVGVSASRVSHLHGPRLVLDLTPCLFVLNLLPLTPTSSHCFPTVELEQCPTDCVKRIPVTNGNR